MNYQSSLFLGIIQGLTEFLPVSSSGHLVILQSIIPSFSQPGVLFDVILHAGTLLAVLVYFVKDILAMKLKYLVLIIIGTIPAALFGYFFQDFLESLFSSVKVVGVALIATSIMNFYTDKIKGVKEKISLYDAFTIGTAQALAIIPGISRSGSTIFAGSTLGIKKTQAAKFSFLLSVPAVFGANLLQFAEYGRSEVLKIDLYFFGFLGAFVAGLVAINLVFKLLKRGNFKIFAYYCLILGVVALLL